MRLYHVRYIISPTVPLAGELFFGISDRDAEDVRVKVSALPFNLPEGAVAALAVDLQMEAGSLDKALQAGFRISNVVGSALSYLARIGLPLPFLKTGFDFTETRKDHEFIQVVDLNVYRRPNARVTKEDFENLVRALNAADPSARDRVPRALRWYAHANQETNPLLRLIAYWFALESLEPLFARSVPRGSHATGPRKQGDNAPKTPGIRSVFEKVLPDGAATYDRIRRLRNGIVHASSKLAQLEDDAKLLHPRLAVVCYAAIAQVLNFSPPGKIDAPTDQVAVQQRLSIRTTIHGAHPGPFHSGNELPHFDEGEFLRAGSRILKLDDLMNSGEVNLKPVMVPGVVVGDTALTIHDRSIEYANVSIVVRRTGVKGEE